MYAVHLVKQKHVLDMRDLGGASAFRKSKGETLTERKHMHE